jgi:glutamate synthase domain-containing protein 2
MSVLWMAAIGLLILVLAVHDRLQRHTPVLRVFPLIGRFTRLVLGISRLADPSAHRKGPFSPSEQFDIRARALTSNSAASFGSEPLHYSADSVVANVALIPTSPEQLAGVELVGTGGSRHLVSHLNFGAMGFGPVNSNVIEAVALAAAKVGCHQNTGEEGVLELHQREGTKLIWQIGTGYWGCRWPDGTFSEEAFQRTVASPAVDCVELKLSQGGKPGAGGMLPAAKNTKRVARILGVPPGIDVVSPPVHSVFHSVETMLEYVQYLGEAAGGKPVGVKVCIGSRHAAQQLAAAIARTGIAPSFITVDGGEGGTGSSVRELQDHAGITVPGGLVMLNKELENRGQRDRLRIFASGGVKNGFDLFRLMCLGADGCFFTRAPLVAMGCVQARLCHTGTCPAGLAAQDPWRRNAISPRFQSRQLANYHRTVVDGFLQLMRASGMSSVADLGPHCLVFQDGQSVEGWLGNLG